MIQVSRSTFMETNGLIVLVIVLVLVIGINGALFMSMRRGRKFQQLNLWRKALGRARDPWGNEDRDLAELSRRVRELEKPADSAVNDG